MKGVWLIILIAYWIAICLNSYPRVVDFLHNWQRKKFFRQKFNDGELDDAEKFMRSNLESLGFRLLVSAMITVMMIALILMSDAPPP